MKEGTLQIPCLTNLLGQTTLIHKRSSLQVEQTHPLSTKQSGLISIFTCFLSSNVMSCFPTYCYPEGKVSTHCYEGIMQTIIKDPTEGKDHNGVLPFLSLPKSSITRNSFQRILTLLSVNYLSIYFFSKVDTLEMQQQGTQEPCTHMQEKHWVACTSINSRADLILPSNINKTLIFNSKIIPH